MDIALNNGLPGFDIQTLVGQSVAILGTKGSGKSTTAAVIIEEIYGHMPLVIVDIESEYWSLKEQFEIIIAGRSPNVDIEIAPDYAEDLARFVMENELSIVLDVSEFNETEREQFLVNFFTSMWNIAFNARKPYQIVLEEAHEFVLQGARSELKTILTRIALRGRKRGLGLITVSQRSAKVEKDILTQAGVVFLHSVRHPVDIKVYQDIIPLPPKQVENMIASLKTGQAIVLYGQEIKIASIRQRHTFHAGYTPGISKDAPPLKSIDASLINKLAEALGTAAHTKNDNLDDSVKGRIEQLQEEVRYWKSKTDDSGEVEKLRQQLGAALIKHHREREEWKTEFEKKTRAYEEKLAEAKDTLKVELEKQARQYEEQLAKNKTLGRQNAPVVSSAGQGGKRIPPITTSGIAAQQRAFNAMLHDIKKTPHLHQIILRYLAERDGESFTVQELSRFMGRAIKTLTDRPPLLLINRGIIQRSGRGESTTYRTMLRDYLSIKFPDLENNIVVEKLINSLPKL